VARNSALPGPVVFKSTVSNESFAKEKMAGMLQDQRQGLQETASGASYRSQKRKSPCSLQGLFVLAARPSIILTG
jgi:hypothetical protein